jgi:hypothetical protein
MVGLPASLTVTLKPAEAALLLASVALHETDVVPIGKSLPERGVQTTLTGLLTLFTSDGAATLKDTALDEPVVESVTLESGPKRGAVVSTTITLKESVVIKGSVLSLQVTAVEPIAKREFGAGEHVEPAGSAKLTFAPPELDASAVMSPLLSQCIADADGVRTRAKTMMKRRRCKLRPLGQEERERSRDEQTQPDDS